jgi:hypothetical protein
MKVNNEVEKDVKQSVVSLFKVSPWHVPGYTEENNENPSDSQCSDRDSNQPPPEYNSEAS